jgi:hypothetical protein
MNLIEAFRREVTPPDYTKLLERQVQALERIAALLEHLTTDNYGRVKVTK